MPRYELASSARSLLRCFLFDLLVELAGAATPWLEGNVANNLCRSSLVACALAKYLSVLPLATFVEFFPVWAPFVAGFFCVIVLPFLCGGGWNE